MYHILSVVATDGYLGLEGAHLRQAIRVANRLQFPRDVSITVLVA